MLASLYKKEFVPRLVSLAASASANGGDSLLISYLFLKQAHLLHLNDLQILQKLAYTAYNLKDYSNAFKYVEKWFSIGSKESDLNIKGHMFLIRGVCSMYLKKYSVASECLKKAVDLFIQGKNVEKANDTKRILEEDLPKAKESSNNKSADEKREECLTIKQKFESNELPEVPDKIVYILPADWIQQWKTFNNYSDFVEDHHKSKNFMKEDKGEIEWLGPIDPSNIIISEPHLIDPRPEELYTNFQLKHDLEENKDFFIVNEEFWDYLYKKYGGIPVQRLTYNKSETSTGVSVETWLQKINVIILPVPSQYQPNELSKTDTIYISKRKTVKDLIEKLIEIYAGHFPKYDFKKVENRVWKVDPRFELGFAWRKWDAETSFEVQGTILNESVSIEDAEISDNDTLIFETHYLTRDWFLSSDVLSKIKSKTETSSISLNNINSFPAGAKKGLAGLQNLGNTCFMNSAIQCLSNTFDLTTFFITDDYKQDINKFNALGSGGKLAYHYSALMKEMWLGNSPYVSPWELKRVIGKLASQFVGYGQQDSQELLSYLLDGLHEDLNRIKDKPFIETKDDDNRPDEMMAQESWENHLKRNQSKIQELTHGQFKSILDCPDCKRVSKTFDPFMMLSLPIPTNEYVKFFLYFVFSSYERMPIKITFNMPTNATPSEIISKLEQITQVPKKNIVMGLLKEHKLVEFVDSSATASYLKEHPGIIFAYDIPPTTFSTPDQIDGKISNNNKMPDSSNQLNGNHENKTTPGSSKIETENDAINPLLKDSVIKVFVVTEAKAFYESEKTFSYTRLIRFEPSDTYKDIHLKVYEKFRAPLSKYFEVQGLKYPVILDDRSKLVIEKEYSKLFPEDNESQWIYKLFVVNTSEDPKTGKRLPCTLCQKSKCNRCPLPNDEGRIVNYMQSMRIQPKDMILELRISKNVKSEAFPLNQCREYKNEGGDETNPNRNYDIYDCLELFTRREKLEKDNAWYCSKCKGHKEALKKMEIYKVPPVLIMHLKRFKTTKPSSIGPFSWGHGKKITSTIDFPLVGLNLTKYIRGPDKEDAIYDLYAVSNHFGGLSGGHYTAFAKNPITNKWYDFDDSRVTSVSEKEVISPAAYALFYRKREKNPEDK